MDVLGGDMREVSVRRGGLSGGLLRIRLRTMQAGHVWGQLRAVHVQRERPLPGVERRV